MPEVELVRLVRPGRVETASAADLAGRMAASERVLIDVGAGDGAFPYREARADPGRLCIGIDAAADPLQRYASRIGRKPARGGVANLVLLVASAEELPAVLSGTADRVTVNFPWGALLRALAGPDEAVLAGLRRLLRPGGQMELALNLHVFEDPALRAALDLPELSLERVDAVLAPAYLRCGLAIAERRLLGPGPLPVRTTWGQRLSLGSRRSTVILRAVAAGAGEEMGA